MDKCRNRDRSDTQCAVHGQRIGPRRCSSRAANIHIVEKLTRVGNELRYDMTIEDPDVFIEPWVMPTRILRTGGGDGIIAERAYCEVYEEGNIGTQLR